MESAMNPFDLLQTPWVILLYSLLILAVLRIVAPDGIDLDDILQRPIDRDCPRGVQEEEPVRWRVELLNPPVEAPRTGAAEPAGQPNAPART